jgi:decaprenylphospho-beta-D-erythro-pentofuranosid-2-ulose 2-reductase
VFDALDVVHTESAIEACFDAIGESVDLVLVTLGLLGDAAADVREATRITENITVNFVWPAVALGSIAQRLRHPGYGRVVVFSSVAGVRIRETNFIYGSAKSGLDGYALGLAETLRGSGVHVQIVRPGFVRTKMTAGLGSAPFAVDPEVVATAVMRGIERNLPIIWVPSTLRWVFLVLRHMPQPLWRRLPG